MLWIQFILGIALIFIAGSRLSVYGDHLAKNTGLGGIWIGAILLAAITSLPELATTTASILFVGSPELSVSNVLGSNIFNLLIIAVLNLVHRKSFFSTVSPRHILSANLGILLALLCGGSILCRNIVDIPSFGMIGADTFAIFIAYLLGTLCLSRFEEEHKTVSEKIGGLLWAKFIASALIVVGTGIALSLLADRIVERYNLTYTFVGVIFLATATSLPEISVCWGAVKNGHYDMGLANILGSNIFNIVIIVVSDVIFIQGAILGELTISHIMICGLQIAMTSILMIGIVFRNRWDSIAIVLIYLIGICFLYRMR